MINKAEIKTLAWQKMDGLLPAIIQDANSHQVLMLGYMNEEALTQTIDTQKVTFYSRLKQRLWMKGEESGNVLSLVDMSYDCDQDALLLLANPEGPTCHLGTVSCFKDNREASHQDTLKKLESVIDQRYQARPEGSYVTSLFESGLSRIAQKVGEEGVETVIAAMKKDNEELKNEVADLLFHTLVLLKERDMPFQEVLTILEERAR